MGTHLSKLKLVFHTSIIALAVKDRLAVKKNDEKAMVKIDKECVSIFLGE